MVLAQTLGLAVLVAFVAADRDCRGSGDTAPSPVSRPRTTRLFERGGSSVLVFVHGVVGQLEGTWRPRDGAPTFAELLVDDPQLSGRFDAYLVGFRSPYLKSARTLQEVSTAILQQLLDDKIFEKYESVYFVGHSMGGLIIQRVLTALDSSAYQQHLPKVKVGVFLSVPSNGASIADTAALISKNPQFPGMKPATLNSWIQSLQDDLVLLRRSDPDKIPLFFAGYEVQSTKGVRVVDRVFATTTVDGPMVAFERNHITITKPEDRDDDVYRWVKARIGEAAARKPSAPVMKTAEASVEVPNVPSAVPPPGIPVQAQPFIEASASASLPLGARIDRIQLFAREAGSAAWTECLPADGGYDCNLGWARWMGFHSIRTTTSVQLVSWRFANFSENRRREGRIVVTYYD